MNDLSHEAIFSLYYEGLAFIDSLFQVWLSVTFAAILSIYFSSDKLTRFMRGLLIFLYCGASTWLIVRITLGGAQLERYQEMLLEKGLEAFPTLPYLSDLTPSLTVSIFVLGTVSTIYFMCTFGKNHSKDGAT